VITKKRAECLVTCGCERVSLGRLFTWERALPSQEFEGLGLRFRFEVGFTAPDVLLSELRLSFPSDSHVMLECGPQPLADVGGSYRRTKLTRNASSSDTKTHPPLDLYHVRVRVLEALAVDCCGVGPAGRSESW